MDNLKLMQVFCWIWEPGKCRRASVGTELTGEKIIKCTFVDLFINIFVSFSFIYIKHLKGVSLKVIKLILVNGFGTLQLTIWWTH